MTVSKIGKTLLGIGKTLRLALPKIGVAWMFALLTVDFNRVAIHELSITAILVTSMLALHYFLSPFQVISGRIADRNPIFGFRRTPYLLIAALVGSSVFVLLPTVIHAVADGATWAYGAGFFLFLVYGIAIAIQGDSHHALIAEVTEPKSRGGVMAVIWTVSILSGIMSAVAFNAIRPEYTPAAMQALYALTPLVVITSAILGIVGLEKRLTGDELEESIERAKRVAPDGNPIQAALTVLKQNPQARGFFAFVFISIFAIFLQDNLLEVFGAEVFNMDITETTNFQPMWGGGVLIGMILMGIVSTIFAIKKRTITMIGSVGTAIGMATIAFAALTANESLVTPSLIGMGFFTGFFNVGALSMMMDMTVEGATGLYMGLWGVAQAFGNGMASLGSGGLHTAFIETGILTPNAAYFLIFGVEAVAMIAGAVILWRLSVTRFHSLHEASLQRTDLATAMEAGAAS